MASPKPINPTFPSPTKASIYFTFLWPLKNLYTLPLPSPSFSQPIPLILDSPTNFPSTPHPYNFTILSPSLLNFFLVNWISCSTQSLPCFHQFLLTHYKSDTASLGYTKTYNHAIHSLFLLFYMQISRCLTWFKHNHQKAESLRAASLSKLGNKNSIFSA